MRIGCSASLLFSLFACVPAVASESPKVMLLASLEWLPYVGAGLERQGLSTFVADAAAQRMGYRVEVDYFPWTRAMQTGGRDPRYAGYFPAYYTEDRAKECHFSAPIGSSTVGLAHLKNTPLEWSTLKDVGELKIGVVSGFSNGVEFDALARQGKLQLDTSPSELYSLRKLLAGRVQAAVIDKLVLRYLLLTDPGLARERELIVFHERPLAELKLHICFQRTPEGNALQKAFDKSLQSLSLRSLENDYFQRVEKRAARTAR